MKRSPMPARKTPMRRTSGPRGRGIAAAVAKHPAGRDVLAANRELAFKRDNWTCQLRHPGLYHACQGPLVAHHRILRSQGGTHDVDNLVTLCDWGHRWVHDNPAAARLLGLYGNPKESTE